MSGVTIAQERKSVLRFSGSSVEKQGRGRVDATAAIRIQLQSQLQVCTHLFACHAHEHSCTDGVRGENLRCRACRAVIWPAMLTSSSGISGVHRDEDSHGRDELNDLAHEVKLISLLSDGVHDARDLGGHHREHLDRNSVELVEAAPGAGLAESLEDRTQRLHVHLLGAVWMGERNEGENKKETNRSESQRRARKPPSAAALTAAETACEYGLLSGRARRSSARRMQMRCAHAALTEDINGQTHGSSQVLGGLRLTCGRSSANRTQRSRNKREQEKDEKQLRETDTATMVEMHAPSPPAAASAAVFVSDGCRY